MRHSKRKEFVRVRENDRRSEGWSSLEGRGERFIGSGRHRPRVFPKNVTRPDMDDRRATPLITCEIDGVEGYQQ